ncbi:hypothetical protein [Halocatena halophila]|uniref:hypothetical protein n=1 Tax=Halocatena halophila TaxID=2814576 RepID=UPI002ED65104
MIDDISSNAWQSLVDELEPATYGELISAIADRLEVSTDDATQAIDQAIDEGTLVEEGSDAAFPTWTVAEDPTEHTSDSTEESSDESEATDDRTQGRKSEPENLGPRDFTNPESGVWAPELLNREQWMGHVEKKPFAPWADRDHPDADPDEDARWKWGITDNYTDGETIAIAEDDPRLDGRAFLQQENDPYAYVDGDDVRCSETGDVHPAFVEVLDQLGATYTDISQSGAGVHANYRGELPEGVKQATWDLDDEPWGDNDELPSIEIYAGKRVCVATGEHVPGTPVKIRDWNDQELHDLLDEHDQLPLERDINDEREAFDPGEHEPEATDSSETTTDIRDQFAAINRIDARRVAADTIVHAWNDDAATTEDNQAFVPTWGKSANGTANIVGRDIWQDTGGGGYGGPVVMALIDLGELRPDTASPRKTRGELWFKGVERLRELGYQIPQYEPEKTHDDESVDPIDAEVVIDPERAWQAAKAATPDDLDDEHARGDEAKDFELDITDNGWACPECQETIDVVRAVAIERRHCQSCQEPLDDALYSDAYQRARNEFGAPLPEYVDQRLATERWDLVQGALEQLTHWHLDSIRSEVVAGGKGRDVLCTIDPSWAESASGERIVAFRSGQFYCREHGRVLDPVRFVALEEEIIDECNAELAGEAFRDAYQCVRERGAPLPRWVCGTPDHDAILPPAEELVGDFETEENALQEARDKVEAGYRACAQDAETMHVRTDDPALGKTTSTVKTAKDVPTLYLAPRKELQQEVAEKAEQYGVTHMTLPVFGTGGADRLVTEATAIVREEGQQLLTDPEALHQRVSQADEEEDGNNGNEPQLAESQHTDAEDDEEVDLDRATCPTATGHHGDAWRVAVAVARQLGFSPAEIHQHAEALFEENLPCQHEDDHEHDDLSAAQCPYTRAWGHVSDPERPIDLLIGSRGHAHVASARTYYERRDESTHVEPRTVTIDEFPGEAFSRSFGEEALDHAVWLAGALDTGDIETRTDLLTTDLWKNDWVRSWLRGDGTEHPRTQQAIKHLDAAEAWVDVQDTVERASHAGAFADTDILDTFETADPRDDTDAIRDAYDAVRDAWAGPRDRIGQQLIDDLRMFFSALNMLETDLGAIEHSFAGPIGALLDRAMRACQDNTIGRGVIMTTRKALDGGEDGCRALAVESDDPHAHPDAYLLLFATVSDETERITTQSFSWDIKEGTTLARTKFDGSTILFDEDHKGAHVHAPPDFIARDGRPNPVVGLDATGREELWALSLGGSVETVNIHGSTAERREFLREIFNIQVVQTTPHMKTYEGPTGSKNFSGDIELVREVAREYGDQRIRSDRLESTGKPGVLTTKCVREEIEPQLEGDISVIDNYGNVTGSNAFAGCRLGVVLGTQHYGHAVAEKWAALGGEEAAVTGRGTDLDYSCEIGNAFLKHMNEDQTMQAILRFGRDEGGALVFAHTAALRDELPVTADGAVVTSHSATARDVREAMRPYLRSGQSFTVSDILEDDAVGSSRRSVQRVLSEFTDLGYLDRHDPGVGKANAFSTIEDPGLGQASLPTVEAPGETAEDPDETHTIEYYTGSVGVRGDDRTASRPTPEKGSVLPAPEAQVTGPPPT